ncbi:5'-nucleotidase domain-containing protein 3-like isoform X2 [Homarus americanus]|uniref:5'-nucleotidase domain-containing protein 3-like isoform X2 n=1 Tax=Homarus americanus TaxID=6706 RepID=UPI001C488F23|nr:5'-nucleotidase domain-containing protein 3-like isoform X2 [Homarus americanus]
MEPADCRRRTSLATMRSLQSIYSLFLAPVRLRPSLEIVRLTGMYTIPKREYSQEFLHKCYQDHRALWESKKMPDDVNPKAVFGSNELDLRDIKVYGFDYDYTLANYEVAVETLIYDLGKNVLVSKYRYPEEIKSLQYNRDFAVRGLHYDIEKGLLMKMDQFQKIQVGSIYRGLTCLSREDIHDIYGTRSLPLHYVEGHLRGSFGEDYADTSVEHLDKDKKTSLYMMARDEMNPLTTLHFHTKMAHLADLFSLPEMCLLSQVAQYFHDHNLPYHSVPLFNDVKAAIASIHPEMHRIVGRNISEYLIKDPSLVTFFNRLKEHKKEIFIITNSPFYFVNAGMSYLLGDDWRDYFDVVVASAKKPAFFTDSMRPFRELNEEIHIQTWGPVTSLDKGKIYLEGNLRQLQQMKGWQGPEVLYFGDHPYSDLADVSLNHSWRTGAIIWELDYEIQCLNSEVYKKTSGWLMILQSLIESSQDFEEEEAREIVRQWEKERDELRTKTKDMFNRHFGSVFRTHDNPTYFSRRLFRFADIYTARLSNLNNYSINHTFYPRRGVLPHEYKSLFV